MSGAHGMPPAGHDEPQEGAPAGRFNHLAARVADRIHRPPALPPQTALSSAGGAGAAQLTGPAWGAGLANRGLKLALVGTVVVLPFVIWAVAHRGGATAGVDNPASSDVMADRGESATGAEGSGGDASVFAAPEASPPPTASPEPTPAATDNSDLDEEAAAKAASPSEGMASSSRCSDGEDNDGDGAIDYPQDQGCASAADNTESSDQPAARVEPAETTDPPPADPPPAAQTAELIQAAAPEPPEPAKSQLSCSSFSSHVVINGQLIERHSQSCGDGSAPADPSSTAAPSPIAARPSDSSETQSPVATAREAQLLSADCDEGVVGGDGSIDAADPACTDATDEPDAAVDGTQPACSDGVDNDGDGYMDLTDPSCESAADDDESPINAAPACKDGMDNDADGLVDLADPDCQDDPNRLSETQIAGAP